MTDLKDYLLVGASSAYSDREMLSEKLGNYTSNLQASSVIAINDTRGLFKEYFSGNVDKFVSLSASLGERRRYVKNAKWIVLFWDGTEISDYVFFASLYQKNLKVVAFSSTRVVNKDRGDAFELYIGRGTPWGNPFAIGNGVDRQSAIEMYREYFQKKFVDDPEGNKAIRSLRGRVLGCHCKPAACHGDVIAEYLNGVKD